MCQHNWLFNSRSLFWGKQSNLVRFTSLHFMMPVLALGLEWHCSDEANRLCELSSGFRVQKLALYSDWLSFDWVVQKVSKSSTFLRHGVDWVRSVGYWLSSCYIELQLCLAVALWESVVVSCSARSQAGQRAGVCILSAFTSTWHFMGGSVAEWLACWTQAQKGPGSNRSRDAVG